MHWMPSLDDLVEENGYVRNRYLTCHNRLVITLWGSFQKAIADLTQLYKGNSLAFSVAYFKPNHLLLFKDLFVL